MSLCGKTVEAERLSSAKQPIQLFENVLQFPRLNAAQPPGKEPSIQGAGLKDHRDGSDSQSVAS